jgi:predicted dehydrogenase
VKVRWGVLSTANIGIARVVPAMQRGQHCQLDAIASRNLEKAQSAARKLGIPKAYGTYEQLLADPEIDAVYIPLPNHLHVPWSIKALEAGKHVLCEKPIGLNAAEARELLRVSRQHPEKKIMEAFMYRHHPQWHEARRLVVEGAIGDLRTIQAFYSYHNVDPNDIRNSPEAGGGGLLDIGCYCISASRLLFGSEPERVLGFMEYDPVFKTDRLTSGNLDLGRGSATFTCSTQLVPYQRVNVFGSRGRLEIEIPFNAPADRPSRIWHHRGSEVSEIVSEICDQYTVQGDLFALAVLNDAAVPVPLEDAVANMDVIDGMVASAREGAWV